MWGGTGALSALLLFVGFLTPSLLLAWGSSQGPRVSDIFRRVLIGIAGAGCSSVVFQSAESELGKWALIFAIIAGIIAIILVFSNQRNAAKLAEDNEVLGMLLRKAFSPRLPLLIGFLWTYLAFIPRLSDTPLLEGFDIHMDMGTYLFAAVFGAWISSTYSKAMTARTHLDMRGRDAVFGSLYLYYGMIGAGVLLVGCLQVDIRAGIMGPFDLFQPGITVMLALSGVGTILAATLRNDVGQWLAAAVYSVGAIIGIYGVVPDGLLLGVPLIPVVLVFAALADSLVSNILLLHFRPARTGDVLRIVASVAICTVGFWWYVSTLWMASHGGQVSVSGQAMFLATVGLLNMAAMIITASNARRLGRHQWCTENSGTFNVTHDALLTYGIVLLGVTLPMWVMAFLPLKNLVALIALFAVGAVGAVMKIIYFSVSNYQSHTKSPAPVLAYDDLSEEEKSVWDGRMKHRSWRQYIALGFIVIWGWVVVIVDWAT